MKSKAILPILLAVALAAAGCRSSTDRSAGTVLLEVNMFNGLPITVSVATGPTQITSMTLKSIVKDPNGTTSSLQDIQMRSIEFTYTRLDNGTRVPPPLVDSIFGTVPVNGTLIINNQEFFRADQLLSPPLSDLTNFGFDQQNGTKVIPLRVTMRFFGRTLSGDDIVSDPASFNLDVVP
ncbi:MAG TPA: hypothetical protein VOA87_20980 [Thermoanaerobaculia bacterium]|nr:hypothetical protein [Thermoanaerobaculia bacterium]